MNRAVIENVDGLSPGMLPPPSKDSRTLSGPRPWVPGHDGQPLRVLFLNANDLGFRSTSRMFERFTAGRDDIDAVHVNMRTDLFVRAASKSGLPYQSWRCAQAWAMVMEKWFRGPLPLDRFDVVLVTTQQRALALARARKRLGHRVPPYLVNIDATCAGWANTFGPARPAIDLDAAMERKVYANAAGVGCYSEWAAESVNTDYGIDADKTFVYVPCVPVPHAADAGAVKAARLAHRLNGGAGEPLRLVFVGNDWERKGGPRLLKWHQQHWKDKAELHVCSAKAPRDNSATNVVWHGAVPNDELMRRLLPSMDVFVMPTLVDASPIAIQEAASCGLPVVSTRIAGIPELVRHGETGFVCERDDERAYLDAVNRLIASPMLLMGMSQSSSRMVAQDLSSDRWLEHLVDNLRSAAAGRAMRRLPETATPTRPARVARAVRAA